MESAWCEAYTLFGLLMVLIFDKELRFKWSNDWLMVLTVMSVWFVAKALWKLSIILFFCLSFTFL